jgi:NADPH-dependent 2,4-dienoyl-CoA reductase/sulfur reductase-like enzyme
MAEQSYRYIIVGAGVAGASAVEGIREMDPDGAILLLGAEGALPYDRPPLSKQLWKEGESIGQIYRHDAAFYEKAHVTVRLGVEAGPIDAAEHTVRDGQGAVYRYERLLLATGGTPRRLEIPGGDLPGISYYRTLGDYERLRALARAGQSALVIGGGFIGSEMAAALCMNKLKVTMVFPDQWLVSRVFPESLGRYLTEQYRAKGVEVLAGDKVVSIQKKDNGYLARSQSERDIRADLVVAGIGITPNIALAQAAGLATGNGVIVNELLQSSRPDIYAAGDIAFFPEQVIGPRRIEHWDNALSQGKQAGRNMAGANEPFTQLPFFFSDLFEFGYEAVGEIDSRLRVFADWQEENKTGVLYYLDGQRLRGAMMCNVWEKVEAARALIRKGGTVTDNELRGAI